MDIREQYKTLLLTISQRYSKIHHGLTYIIFPHRETDFSITLECLKRSSRNKEIRFLPNDDFVPLYIKVLVEQGYRVIGF
jgi:hypothetical protein